MQSPTLQEYRLLLETQGPAGLDFLNSRVPHRYTGIFRLQEGALHNIFLHDKRGEIIPEFLQVVPLTDSFCHLTMRDGVFRTADSTHESSLDGHKYQGVLRSYIGLPLADGQGGLYGTICHFDERALELADEEFEIFSKAAKLLPDYLGKPVLRPGA
ncbi:guanylate cyclase [Comamonas endophytica]|uniref:Guanylate cyclase n=1 Tax=Comamonas endophytica TaxID=2949090 RepID=A0ABY6GF02_9BURK|nr:MULTISPECIES: guanylate cyclase [unclassified Acidovorax]MCD2514381.1 guanylate cyclase [Acidovorax sp. D4N7]UYG53671.1 guanylate cyclase [Acidovorax sp. 5MLIR]